jgi:hypothetical protein
MDNDFKYRGVNLILLIKIATYATLTDSNNPCSARISNVLLGSHESTIDDFNKDGTPKNRWVSD